MSPASRLCSLHRVKGAYRGLTAGLWVRVGLVAVSGCGASAPLASGIDPPTVDTPVRQPDAVSVELAPAMPTAASRASAGGVVALRIPVRTDAVMNLLGSFFEAWQGESLEGLAALLSPDAGPLEARSRGSRVLVEGWRQRLRAHEYGRLAGREMIRRERIERWDPDDLGTQGALARLDVHPGEFAVRVPLEVTSVGGERLFGDAVLMLLRADGGKLRIAAYGEVEGR
jgi:hypothetical protein